jgi:hypothetical protein
LANQISAFWAEKIASTRFFMDRHKASQDLTGLNWCAFALQGWKDAMRPRSVFFVVDVRCV